MDEKRIAFAVLGMTVIGILVVNHKLNKRTEALREAVIATADVIDSQYQAQIDALFEDIVENYDR